MNAKQRLVVVVGFVVILGMGLYPPWRLTITQPVSISPSNPVEEEWAIEVGGGYAWLTYQPWMIPEVERRRSEGCGVQVIRVDTSLLLCQWFLVSAVTVIFVIFLGDRPPCSADKQDE